MLKFGLLGKGGDITYTGDYGLTVGNTATVYYGKTTLVGALNPNNYRTVTAKSDTVEMLIERNDTEPDIPIGATCLVEFPGSGQSPVLLPRNNATYYRDVVPQGLVDHVVNNLNNTIPLNIEEIVPFVHYDETSYGTNEIINRGIAGTTFDLTDGSFANDDINGLYAARFNQGRLRNVGADLGDTLDIFMTIETPADVSGLKYLFDARTCGTNRNVRLFVDNGVLTANAQYTNDENITTPIIESVTIQPNTRYAIWFRNDGGASKLNVITPTESSFKNGALERTSLFWGRLPARCSNTFVFDDLKLGEMIFYATLISNKAGIATLNHLASKWGVV